MGCRRAAPGVACGVLAVVLPGRSCCVLSLCWHRFVRGSWVRYRLQSSLCHSQVRGYTHTHTHISVHAWDCSGHIPGRAFAGCARRCCCALCGVAAAQLSTCAAAAEWLIIPGVLRRALFRSTHSCYSSVASVAAVRLLYYCGLSGGRACSLTLSGSPPVCPSLLHSKS